MPAVPFDKNKLSKSGVAKLLGISTDDVSKLEQQHIISPIVEGKSSYFDASEIASIKSNKGVSLVQAAAQVGVDIQRETVTKVSKALKILYISGAGLLGYIILIVLIAVLFMLFPLKTATWLGYAPRTQNTVTMRLEGADGQVLASTTDTPSGTPTILQTFLRPASRASLDVVKLAKPTAYQEVASVTILDPNDVLTPEPSGAVVPVRPIKFADNSLLEIADSSVVENLNSQFLQGKQPGTNVGDIALVTTPQTPVDITTSLVPTTLTTLVENAFDPTTITGLTDDNLADDAGIADTKLDTITESDKVAASALQLRSGGGISDSSGLSLLTSCASGEVLEWDGSNWVCAVSTGGGGVTSLNALTGGLTIAGGGINSVSSGGSTITITGTLPGVGTAGTYGSGSLIPVFTTDAQGRVSAVTNTALSGLTVSNFASSGISQWTNDSGFITASSTDTLSNKTLSALTNTITGLTNSNLSGSAGITNANLANSSISTSGNSGTGSVSLGGGLTFTGAGISNIVSSGSTLTVTSTEADTLATVTGRGSSTTTDITTTGSINIGTSLDVTSGTILRSGLNSLGNISLGTGISVASPSLLKLDYGSLNSDPTGSNGATYYNANTNKFRCFQGGAWTDCISTLSTATSFTDGGNTFGVSAELGTLDSNTLTFLTNGVGRITLDTSGRVGIGTSNPTQTLDVSGNGNFAGSLTVGNTLSTNTLTVTGSETVGSSLTVLGVSRLVGDVTTAGVLGVGSSLDVTSGGLFRSVMNVLGNLTLGTGTSVASPSLLGLDRGILSGDPTGSNGAMYYNSNSNQFRCFRNSAWENCGAGAVSASSAFVDNGNSFGVSAELGTLDANTLTFLTSGVGRMTLDTSGRLGIGTSTPTQALDVAGNSNFTGSLSVGNTLSTNTLTVTGSETVGSSLSVSGGTMLVGPATTQNNLGVGGSLTVASGSRFIGNVTTGGELGVGSSLDVTSGSLFRSVMNVLGNLTLGTGTSVASPSLLALDRGILSGDPTGSNGAMYYNSNSNQFRCFRNSAWETCGAGAVSSLNAFVNNGNAFGSPGTLGTTDSNLLSFITSGAGRMTILSTGEIGIGTSSPTQLLDVNGGGNFAGSLSVGNTLTTNSLFVTGNVGIGATPNVNQPLIITKEYTDGTTGQSGLTLSLDSTISSGFSQVRGLNMTVKNSSSLTGGGAASGVVTGGLWSIQANGTQTYVTNNFTGLSLSLSTLAGQTGSMVDTNGIRINTPSFAGTKPTSVYGLNFSNQGVSGVTDSTAIKIQAQSGSSSNYAITSAFGNLHGFGTATPGKTVDIVGTLVATGATDIGTSGASNVTIATTGTGNVDIGNSIGTFSLISNGGLNVTTGGALTGVSSIDTISTTSTGLTFAGAGSVSATSGDLAFTTGSGNINLTVGSSAASGKFQIGNSATATPDLLVLDNGTADPTGVNGGMYYNASTTKFRCYQAGAWADCIAAASSGFSEGGNSFGVSAELGTLDSNNLTFLTGGVGRMTVTSAGNVGIGTSSPSYNLSVVGTSASGNIASFTNLNASDSAASSVLRIGIGTPDASNTLTRFIQFMAGVTTDSNGTGVGNIKIQNSGVQYVSGNADLAEWTEVAESVADGDIIASLSSGNLKALPAQLLLGVVTDTAAFVGNDSDDNSGKAIVGMLGRVNTKVGNENGDIAIGDPIAASSVAGVGMKQTKAGPTIGKALAAKTGATVERIAVQVIPGWYDPDPLLDPSSFTISGTNVLDQNSDVVTRVGGFEHIFAGEISVGSTVSTQTLNATGNLTLGTGTSVASPALLKLASGMLAGDPTGSNGAQYYNANTNKFRCFQNGAWTDCISSASSGFAEGGNSFGVSAELGTLDSNTLTFITNGVGRITLDTSGRVGIGTSSPTQMLDVSGNGNFAGSLTVGNTLSTNTLTVTGSETVGSSLSVTGGTMLTGPVTSQDGLGVGGSLDVTSGGLFRSSINSLGNITLGTGTSIASPPLLKLGLGILAGDPSGTNGSMYYNSNTNKFRCFENGAWANCVASGGAGSDLQHAISTDTTEALTNIPTGGAQTALGTVSVTPTTANGDIYVSGFAEVRSGNNTDQPFNLVIETTSNCTGSTVGNASVTYTVTSAASTTIHIGNVRVAGIAVDAGASAHPYSLCAAVTSGGGDTDVLNWGIEALVIDTGADLAEIYTTNDNNIEVGDVVSLDSSLQTGMKKSETSYDQNVLGIVSTNPGLVIGSVSKEGVNAMPVALSGRVPVKISAHNGVISVGDPLTSSSIPGVAMKATKAGSIIGTAMEGFNGEGVGQILVFVKNGSSLGTALPEMVVGDTTGFVNHGQFILTQLLSNPISQVQESVNLSNVMTDRVVAGLEIITPKITTQDILETGVFTILGADGAETVKINPSGDAIFRGTLTVNTLKANRIEGLEILTNHLNPLPETINFGGSNILSATSEASDLSLIDKIAQRIADVFKHAVDFFGNVSFHSDVNFLGRPTFNKDTAGHATILKGSTAVRINFEKEYSHNPVVMANINLTEGESIDQVPPYAIYDLSTKGFNIKMSQPAPFNIDFSWNALSVGDQPVSESKPTELINPAETINSQEASKDDSELQPETPTSPEPIPPEASDSVSLE